MTEITDKQYRSSLLSMKTLKMKQNLITAFESLKNFTKFLPRANAIKLFTAVIYVFFVLS